MSTRYSLSQRTSTQNSLFAALACAITMTLMAGPAMAQSPAMDRVEIHGRVVEAPARTKAVGRWRPAGATPAGSRSSWVPAWC